MKTLRISAVLLALGLLVAPLSAQSLATTFAGGNGSDGNMFDLVASRPISIRTFDINLNVGTHLVEVYAVTNGGSYIGHEATPGDWTLVASGMVTSAGADVATLLPFNISISLQIGETLGFYVTTDVAGGVQYTNGSNSGSNAAINIDLAITEGLGVQYPFGLAFGTTTPGGTSRIWNGRVRYTRPIAFFPFNETFDSVTDNLSTVTPAYWEQARGEADPADGSIVDWRSNTIFTGSGGTGPTADHTTGIPGAGTYFYVEDSVNDHFQVNLMSRWFNFTGETDLALTFWYHSRKGTRPNETGGTNELFVDLIQDDGTIFSSVTQLREADGSDWHMRLVDLRPFSSVASGVFRVRFRVNNNNDDVSSFSFTHDIAIDDFRIGSFDFFGTNEDLVVGTEVNGRGGASSPVEEVVRGDALRLSIDSPNGTFFGLPPSIVCQLHLDGNPPGNILPDLHVDLNNIPAFVILDGTQNFGLLGPRLLGPGGELAVAFTIPALLMPNLTLRVQGIVSTPTANNGIYATTLLHIVDIQ